MYLDWTQYLDRYKDRYLRQDRNLDSIQTKLDHSGHSIIFHG